jgi:hypothetical protein
MLEVLAALAVARRPPLGRGAVAARAFGPRPYPPIIWRHISFEEMRR